MSFIAAYSGVCAAEGDKIEPGNEVGYQPEGAGLAHNECGIR